MSHKDASADIDDLDAFRHSLDAYAKGLYNETHRMINAMNQVNQTWNDKIQQQFMDVFVQNLSGISRMQELIEQHSLYVKGKADKLREYVQNGY